MCLGLKLYDQHTRDQTQRDTLRLDFYSLPAPRRLDKVILHNSTVK